MQEYQELYGKAIKNEKCFECLRTIKKGEQMMKVFGLDNPEIQSLEICLHCTIVKSYMESQNMPIIYGDMVSTLETMCNENNFFKVYRCIVGNMRQWQNTAKNKLMRLPNLFTKH